MCRRVTQVITSQNGDVSFPAAGRHMTCLPTLKRSKGQSNYSERMTFTRRTSRFKTILKYAWKGFNVTDWRVSSERHEGNSGIHCSRRVCVCDDCEWTHTYCFNTKKHNLSEYQRCQSDRLLDSRTCFIKALKHRRHYSEADFLWSCFEAMCCEQGYYA